MKKRYQVTLTQESAEELKAILRELKVESAEFSRILDGYLTLSLPIFRAAAEARKTKRDINFKELMSIFGEGIDTMEGLKELL